MAGPVPAIPVFLLRPETEAVEARHKAGHDGVSSFRQRYADLANGGRSASSAA
jgi:hypothetical protein